MIKPDKILDSITHFDQENFSLSLKEAIAECENKKLNKILVNIYLSNIDFLLLNYDKELIKYNISLAKEIIKATLNQVGLHYINIYQVREEFFLILPELNELLADLTFKIFKALQISEISKGSLFYDFKLASILFPKFGGSEEILLNKLKNAYFDKINCSSSYHIIYDDNNNIKTRFENDYQRANTFKSAISDNRVRFAFQPIVSCKTGHINHYECLLRIVENNRLISAGPLIPVAEKLGFISIVDDMVVDMVIEELKRSNDINFAINISNLGVSNSYLLDKIKDKLSDSNLASRLIIEITETAAQDDLDKTKHFIKAVHNLGCKVAIDDFGAGYTSFRQLKLLPIDLIKIDGWFIRDVLDNLDNRFFVETLVRMAEELGTQTVAEFVENGEIAKFLLDIDVDYMQGNYFSPAVVNRSWIQSKKE